MVRGIRSYDKKERRKIRRQNHTELDIKPPRRKARRVDFHDKENKYSVQKRYDEGEYEIEID